MFLTLNDICLQTFCKKMSERTVLNTLLPKKTRNRRRPLASLLQRGDPKITNMIVSSQVENEHNERRRELSEVLVAFFGFPIGKNRLEYVISVSFKLWIPSPFLPGMLRLLMYAWILLYQFLYNFLNFVP